MPSCLDVLALVLARVAIITIARTKNLIGGVLLGVIGCKSHVTPQACCLQDPTLEGKAELTPPDYFLPNPPIIYAPERTGRVIETQLAVSLRYRYVSTMYV
ncbi:hypothetical protein DER46DRAFT_609054 [Fusarium sp. MPI-SDFR-AT-0072]|nr:hypothetical protein DER46DRAFT_609054 [Fusarium sp. MPI-SDFR-AT-0072]